MSLRITCSIFFAALSSLGLYAQTDIVDYYTCPVNYEDLLDGGDNLGAGGYFNVRWYIDGTELQQLCIGKSDLTGLFRGTGCLLMIGSEGNDYVKRCLYGYVEPYGKSVYVLGLGVLCYVFCFDYETIVVSNRWEYDSSRSDNIDMVIAIMSLFYEKATISHNIDAKIADYLLYCLANDLFGGLINFRGGKRYSNFNLYENLQNEYTEIIVSVLHGEPYGSEIYYDRDKLRYFGKDHSEQMLDEFYSKYMFMLSEYSIMGQIQKFVGYSRVELNDLSSVDYEETVMLDIIGLLDRHLNDGQE